MDHIAVVREKMTEKYLLDELDGDLRDEFEQHYFDCPECALDVQAGVHFIEHSKDVLAEKPEPVPVRARPVPVRQSSGWFGFSWFRPAFAAPVFALLLAVVGYQNLVTVPGLRAQLQPQVLPMVPVNAGTWGAGGPANTVPAGKGLLLLVRIPQDSAYVRYTADLYNPAGKLECSLAIPATAGQDRWPVSLPTVNRMAGTYTMTVHGITATGESKDLGTSFELQIQK